jgi:hypothetical protein
MLLNLKDFWRSVGGRGIRSRKHMQVRAQDAEDTCQNDGGQAPYGTFQLAKPWACGLVRIHVHRSPFVAS